MENELKVVYRKIIRSIELIEVCRRINEPQLLQVYRPILNKDIPEEWHKISDYLPEVKSIYWISNYGRFFREDKNCIIPSRTTHYGYSVVSICYNTCKCTDYTIHRLVMICFNYISNYEDMIVNHIDGNKQNNHISNLEWCTYKENLHHALNYGLKKIGEDHNKSNITNHQAKLICQGLVNRMSYKNICEQLLHIPYTDLMKWIICDIKRGNTWKSISSLYPISETNKNNQLFDNDQIRVICECLEKGMDYEYILRLIGVDLDKENDTHRATLRGMISKIKLRKRFSNVSQNYNF